VPGIAVASACIRLNLYQRLECRYKLSSVAAGRLVSHAVRDFEQVYALQRRGATWRSSAELWQALGLAKLTTVTLSHFFSAAPVYRSLITKRYVREIAAALTRVNYNQSPDAISALAGLIGLAPDGTTFMVEGGMSQVARGLIKRALPGAVHLGSRVSRIERVAPAQHVGRAQFALTFSKEEGVRSKEARGHALYDAVVIAAPMRDAGIELAGMPEAEAWAKAARHQPYQTVHSTFVRGALRAAYFGVGSADAVPGFVGTAQGSAAPFSSISRLEATGRGNGTQLFKMFTVGDPRKEALRAAFEDGAVVVAHKKWHAYPQYRPPEALGPFRVAEGLYYTNAIETGASCIEISAIAGVSVAKLVATEVASLRAGATSRNVTDLPNELLRVELDL
jgi:prenylcysteine oxidase / farnesylcysteine lyase